MISQPVTRRSLIGGLLACAVARGETYRTVGELWAGYDPRALPLAAEVAQQRRAGDIVVRKVFYTSEVLSGFTVRVIAYYAYPAGAKGVPAILHIHGGGQTATREYVEYWAKRGYAALSINWGGYPLERNPANGNTDWGPINANQADTTNTYRVQPNARVNSWYHWTIACRRGLTFLQNQPEVDAARLGIFGVSMGGRLTWLVAGCDDRVKAAISIYGAVRMSDPLPGQPGSEQVRFSPEDARVWRSCLDASAYAPRIRCPFFFLSASDDFYGCMDFVEQALDSVPYANTWRSYSPHCNHHVEPEQSAAIPLWMDRWLKRGEPWPKTPGLSLDLKDYSDPTAKVSANRARNVSIFYSTDPHPQSRFWRSAAVEPAAGGWRARLPLTVADRDLYVFANVLYDSGLSLSTRLVRAKPGDLGHARDHPTLLLEDFSAGMRDWFVPEASPNPIIGDKPTTLALQDANWRVATRKIADPKWQAPAGAALEIQVKTAEANTLLVIATENEQRRPAKTRVFIAQAPLKGGDWETVRLPLSRFRAVEGGTSLTSWAAVNLLTLRAHWIDRPAPRLQADAPPIGRPWRGSPPVFRRIEWIRPASG